MRVYEYAKEHGVVAKDLLTLLADAGFKLASHMSVLPPEAIEFLNKKYAPPVVAKEEKKSAPAPAVAITKKEEMISVASSEKPKPIVQKSEKMPVINAPTPTPSRQTKIEQEAQVAAPVEIILEPTVLSDFAAKANKPVTDVILSLLKWGILSNKNQLLPVELLHRLARHYELATVAPVQAQKEEAAKKAEDGEHGQERLPIVVVMGHVDHGKTTLLDYIRKTRVAARERGGITQHLGAYEAKTAQGSIIFLDTPGHEAFSKIRARGAHIADIAILVVAADDGIMPQTIEAVKHAQAMKVPIIVALNKIDKAEANRIDVIRNELSQQFDLLPEEWGGSTIYVPISAKMGTNVDKLLEMIVLQSQVMELKADASAPAEGYVLEAKMEKGLGPVATFIAQRGTLRIGDYFTCGATGGKVSAIVDSFGKRLSEVGPSYPVQVAGLDQLPAAGDELVVVSKQAYADSKRVIHEQKAPAPHKTRMMGQEEINIIIKTDTNSSKEALVDSIHKISKKLEKGYAILQSGIGSVSESDVVLAADTKSRIVVLHAKVEPSAALLAQRLGVTIQSFDIIYKLLEHLQEYSDSLKAVKMIRKKIGEASVRKVFDIKDLGVIAGSYIKEGIFTRDGSVVIWRGTRKVGEGKINSLQRDRRSVKEVHAGFECAFMVDGFREWEVDDRVECFTEQPELPKK